MAEDAIAGQVKQRLSTTQWKCAKLERIAGGNANFTYRGYLEAGGSIVIKHAEPYVALNKEYQLDVTRSNYEWLMLETLSNEPATSSGSFSVRTPKVLSSIEHTKLVEDLPNSLTIKAYLSRYGSELALDTAHELGVALGAWLAWFHGWLNSESAIATNVQDKLKDSPMVEPRANLYIGSYQSSMAQFPEIKWPSNEEFAKIEAAVRKMYTSRGEAIHGDFWTGNMILEDKPLPKLVDTNKPTTSDIFILDFEVSQLGSKSQDLAQCLAELYMVHHFFGAEAPLQVMRGLVDGYFRSTQPGAEGSALALQIAMHFGIHIVVIPWRYGWPKGEKLVECVRFGNECLVHGFANDVDWFKDGPLGYVFSL